MMKYYTKTDITNLTSCYETDQEKKEGFIYE